MNPLVAALLSVAANVVAALVAARSARPEARAATAAGAAISVGAAALCAVPLLVHSDAPNLGIGTLALQADALVGTLLLPFALATGAVALGTPRRVASPRTLAAASLGLAAATLALLANNLLVLVFAEVCGGLALAWGLGEGEHHAGRLYLGVAGLLVLGALGTALAQRTALVPLGAGLVVSPVVVGLLLVAVLVRLGTVPLHTGLTATLGGAAGPGAVLLAAPMGGVALLVKAIQPSLVGTLSLSWLPLALLGAATFAALQAAVARDLGRSAAWTLAALNGLVVAGNVAASPTGALGGELLWAASVLSEVGFVLAILMVTRRLGATDLRRLHGLQGAAPVLSLLFLVVALAIAGVPGTLEFVANDVLLSGTAAGGLPGTVLTVGILALIGFNALRLYSKVFYGAPQGGHVEMDIRTREKASLLLVATALLAGGVAPGLLPLVAHAAEAVAAAH